MGVPLRKVRDRVRIRLRDFNTKEPTYLSVEYDQAIASGYINMAARIPPPSLYTASAFTISAGADTFQLPATVTQYTGGDGGAEYAGLVRIQLASTGAFLRKVTGEEMDHWRNSSPSVQLGVPNIFTLWEENDLDAQGRCYPGAKVAEVCNLFRTLSVDDVRDFIGSGSDDMDDVEILFSRVGVEALEAYVAADLLARLSTTKTEALGLDKGVIKLWLHEADVGVYKDSERRLNVEAATHYQRNVP